MRYPIGLLRPKSATDERGAVGESTSGDDLEGGYFRESPRKARRRRPCLRFVFALFVVIEVVILAIVNEYSPVFDFEITSVTAEDGTTVSLFLW